MQACPGTTVCRFGVLDSLGLGMRLEKMLVGYELPATTIHQGQKGRLESYKANRKARGAADLHTRSAVGSNRCLGVILAANAVRSCSFHEPFFQVPK